MKLKTLITPFLLLLIVIFCIWVVYPAYSNGNNGVKEKYSQLKKEQDKLNRIQNKSNNVKKLATELSSSEKDINVLNKFIPLKSKGEEIEDNLNYLASSAGLSVLSINLSHTRGDSIKNSNPKFLTEATINVFGNYVSLKKFVSDVSKLRRYNNIKSLNITKNIINNSDQGNTGGNLLLKANINIEFVELAKVKLTDENIDNPIFSSDKLNLDVISQIRKSKSVNILPTKVGEKGKADPFMP